jgi:hypothetical protein
MAGQTVRIGSREIVVEESPLPVTFGGPHFKFALRQPEPGQLRLLPTLGVRVVGWVFSALGWPVLILGILALRGLWLEPTAENVVAVLLLLGWGCPFAFFGAVLLGPWYRFDTSLGRLTIRHFWRTRRRPLADVVAVQVLAGVFPGGKVAVPSYQLNLVFDDPNEPRLFVAYNPDAADMVKKAKLLADFLHVPLLAAAPVANKLAEEGRPDAVPPTGEQHPDPTRHWPITAEPLPPFDLEAGALGGLRLGDGLAQAAFLGRPDRVEQTAAWLNLNYAGRGFQLEFDPDGFVTLTCHIAAADVPPKPGQGFCRPRLSGGTQLTPETTVAQVRAAFGPPDSEEEYPHSKILTYLRDRFSMEFEFEPRTEKLLVWSAVLDD